MNLNNKRGVSGVVTAVLLILLVIAAIGILWVVVQNFIEQGTEGVEGTGACFETDFEVIAADATTDTITVRRTGGSAVTTTIRVGTGTESGSVTDTTADISVGESVDIPGFTVMAAGPLDDVVVAFEINDQACPVLGEQSITAT